MGDVFSFIDGSHETTRGQCLKCGPKKAHHGWGQDLFEQMVRQLDQHQIRRKCWFSKWFGTVRYRDRRNRAGGAL